jgi:hypothetical protein
MKSAWFLWAMLYGFTHGRPANSRPRW